VEKIQTTFPAPLVRTIVLMIGELEFDDTFESSSPSANYAEYVLRLVLFFSFLITVPITFFNLLTAFALDELQVSDFI